MGRCSTCGESTGSRYALIEVACGVLFALIAWRFDSQPLAIPAYLWFVSAGLALAVIDLDTMRLPNVLTLSSYPAVGVLLLIPAIGYADWSAYLRTYLAGAAVFVIYAILVAVYPRGMGLGDLKLSGVIGMVLGWVSWATVVVGGFLGFFLGAVVGGGLMLSSRATRKTKIPFGPFMIMGAVVAIFVGNPLANWYTHTFG